MSLLKCRVPGCRARIRGWTGLQELQKLKLHMARAHLVELDGMQVLELRSKWEQQEEEERRQEGR